MTSGCSAELEILGIADLEEAIRFVIMGRSNYM
jgi:hypothetical protein